ncbi:MAG: amidohydrolase family protein [Actinomycetota bacterium]|nr:amidohydrolase family protein [Actinomycetota bacterium]
MERIEADLLIPGRGRPVQDVVVVLDGTTIRYAGPTAAAPSTPNAAVTKAPVVMPGLWDCHGHFLGVRSLDLAQVPMESEALRAARATVDLRAALNAGVTTVRELGGLGIHLAQAVKEGTVDGPSIYAAGAMLSTTGGHGDFHRLPLAWVIDFSHRDGEIRLADGVDECVRATREQLRRNARLIKVCASGGVLSEVDDPIHQQFTVKELQAIVEVAGMADRVVAAHCHGKPGIMAALEAGVRTIEHGTYLDDEACAAMREAGAVLVPTRTVISELLGNAAAPPYAMIKLRALEKTHAAAISMAHDRGVTIAMGTDVALSGRDLPASWGRNGLELPLLVRAGLSPLEAIEAATANGPLTLGPQAPSSGQLVEGWDADVITVDANPLADITVLADQLHVTGVWVRGRRVKG